MREYNITMTFAIESEDANYNHIVDYANELSKKITDSEDIISINDDVEIIEVSVDEIENLNGVDSEYGYDEEEEY